MLPWLQNSEISKMTDDVNNAKLIMLVWLILIYTHVREFWFRPWRHGPEIGNSQCVIRVCVLWLSKFICSYFFKTNFKYKFVHDYFRSLGILVELWIHFDHEQFQETFPVSWTFLEDVVKCLLRRTFVAVTIEHSFMGTVTGTNLTHWIKLIKMGGSGHMNGALI